MYLKRSEASGSDFKCLQVHCTGRSLAEEVIVWGQTFRLVCSSRGSEAKEKHGCTTWLNRHREDTLDRWNGRMAATGVICVWLVSTTDSHQTCRRVGGEGPQARWLEMDMEGPARDGGTPVVREVVRRPPPGRRAKGRGRMAVYAGIGPCVSL